MKIVDLFANLFRRGDCRDRRIAGCNQYSLPVVEKSNIKSARGGVLSWVFGGGIVVKNIVGIKPRIIFNYAKIYARDQPQMSCQESRRA